MSRQAHAMSGNSPHSRDIAYALHPFTNLRLHESRGPVIVARGDGVRVYDDGGKDYIEALSGLWCTSLGFSETRLADVAADAMRNLPFYHQFGHKAHGPGIDLAEALIGLAADIGGPGMAKVFFTNSGSEANDSLLKLVWYYNNALGRPERKKIISRVKGYHGVTIATASLTALPHVQTGFDLPIDRILHTGCPHHYRFAEPGESEPEFAGRLAEDLEALIQREGPETIAAFIAEPVMGAGGVIVPPAGYFPKIQAVLRRYDILFIADEVICGFHRTGNPFGSQTFDIEPDMISVAKALSSGYLPIGAAMVSDRIYQAVADHSDQLGVFGHGFTYSGHPVSAAVALDVLRIYEERDVAGHVRRVGPHLQQALGRFRDHPLVGEVRGVGLIGAVELVADKATGRAFDPARKVGPHCAARAEAHGMITRAMGDAIAFCPPLVIDESEIDEMMRRFAAALEETWRMVREQGLADA